LRDVPLLLTTQNNCHQEDLKNLTKLTFESKNTPALFFVRKGVSVLFANGKTNGINLESSHHQTHIIPVYDGYSLRKHSKSINIGGKIVNDYILDLIKKQRKGQNLTAPFELFPGDVSSEGKNLKYVSRKASQSYRQYAENKVIQDLKPVLNKRRQIKQGE
jgi:actin-related protein